MSAAVEDEYRFFACELLSEAGVLLDLPQVVSATGQALIQRFYYRRPFTIFDAHIAAMAALFLAAKVEEVPRRMRDILNVVYHLKLRRQGKADRPLVLGGVLYTRWKLELIKTERFILKELGFSLYNLMEHPHAFILYYVAALNGSATLANRAWAFLNDSLRLDLCVRYRAEAIACAAINLAARTTGEPLPRELPWWEVFGTTAGEMEAICEAMLRLYAAPHHKWLPSLRPGALATEDMDSGEETEAAAPMSSAGDEGAGAASSFSPAAGAMTGPTAVSSSASAGADSAAAALQARIDASAAHFVAASADSGVGAAAAGLSSAAGGSSSSSGSDAVAAAHAAADTAKAVAAARAAALAAAARAAGVASSGASAAAVASSTAVSSLAAAGPAAAEPKGKGRSKSRSRSRDRHRSSSKHGSSRDRSRSPSRDRRRHSHRRSGSHDDRERHDDRDDRYRHRERDRYHRDDRDRDRARDSEYRDRRGDGGDGRRQGHHDHRDAGADGHRRSGEGRGAAPDDDGGRWGQ